MDERGKGDPLTERERAARHFGVEASQVTPEMIQELPPRGTGLKTVEAKESKEKVADELVSMVAGACKCATSFNLALFLTDTTMDWARDKQMRKYVRDHIQRIDTGLDYLEKDCGCKMPERARSDIEAAIDQLNKQDWEAVRAKMDDLYIQIDRAIVNCSGYLTPHF